METPLGPYRATREDLMTLVLHQREQIADLKREQAWLRAGGHTAVSALGAAGAGRCAAGGAGAER